jgi:hypothetical protein
MTYSEGDDVLYDFLPYFEVILEEGSSDEEDSNYGCCENELCVKNFSCFYCSKVQATTCQILYHWDFACRSRDETLKCKGMCEEEKEFRLIFDAPLEAEIEA